MLEQLSADLQKELPGLRGFSRRSMLKMIQFADAYGDILVAHVASGQSEDIDDQVHEIVPLTTAQFEGIVLQVFFSVGFSHHILLLTRCKDWLERWFYMQKTVSNQWTVDMLDWQIKARVYQKRDQTLPNNFANTLPYLHVRA